MKSQKTNAFQLAVAGGVLVLVLVCATFAWFAVGNHASVGQILASVSSPKVPSQFNSIQYEQSNNIWSTYNGQHLELVPGKTWRFKVYFTAQPTDTLKMSLSQISAELREPQTESDVQEGTETTAAPVDIYNPVVEENMLSKVLLVSVNGGAFQSIDELAGDGASALIFNGVVGEKPENATQYEYTYEIKMDENAGNIYMDKVLSFVLEADLITEESGEEAEG
ncbi:MAG: hypothetical protein IKK85_09920 [Clostridia bacterium]|nr:hypothetical protein [Clostridia bacterium]